jgi:WD40 repeat protein
MALSPDGKTLAISGHKEVLLLSVEKMELQVRLAFGSPRITSLVFSTDGKVLYAAGGTSGQFGHLQAWDVEGRSIRHNWRTSSDTLFGLSISKDQTQAAFGCADRTLGILNLKDGREVLNLQLHTDWVFGTAFSADGLKLLTTSRDKSLKRIDLPSGNTMLDLAEPLEPGSCLARSPDGKMVVMGTATGSPRLYRVEDLAPRTEKQKDPNLARQCERLKGPVNAVAFSPDGKLFAAAATGEVKVFTDAGNRTASLAGHTGPVNAIAFSPDGKTLFTAGFDSTLRWFDTKSGKLQGEIIPEPWRKSPGTTPTAK